MTTATITIQEASGQLGLSEEEFRKLLTGIIKNPTTAKKIPLEKFKLIGEMMKTHAEQLEQPEETEQEDTLDNEESLTVLQEESAGELATTTEETQLDQERTRIQLNINLNLQNQVLNLNKITSALAVVAGEEAVKNFEEIYTHTVNTGVDRVISRVAQETYQTIQQLREVDNVDFLTSKDRAATTVDTQQAIDQVLQLL